MSHPLATTHNMHWSGSGQALWGELRLDGRDPLSQGGSHTKCETVTRFGCGLSCKTRSDTRYQALSIQAQKASKLS
eukprot:3344421-Rhodomonas_salina.1